MIAISPLRSASFNALERIQTLCMVDFLSSSLLRLMGENIRLQCPCTRLKISQQISSNT
jgi:hypothetical protein